MTDRVLVADDSLTIQKVIKIALSRFAVDVICVESLTELISSASKGPFHAIITDASLPGAYGVDDFKKLTSAFPGVPVILLVGSYETIDEQGFKNEGFSHFFKKPFEASDIVKVISKVLGHELGRSQTPTAAQPKSPAPQKLDQKPIAMEEESPPESVASIMAEEGTEIPLTPIEIDEKLRGKPAFSLDSLKEPAQRESQPPQDTQAPRPKGLPPIPKELPFDLGQNDEGEERQAEDSFQKIPTHTHTKPTRAVAPPNDFDEPAAEALREELAPLVRKAVQEYCDKHFPELAREIITNEIRRLADEKTRYLVDN